MESYIWDKVYIHPSYLDRKFDEKQKKYAKTKVPYEKRHETFVLGRNKKRFLDMR